MKTIEIPNNVFIPCPKKGFKQVSVKNACADCEHSKGLVEICEGVAPFKDKYRVLCGFPISRRFEEIEL